jgi:hypothetical protein
MTDPIWSELKPEDLRRTYAEARRVIGSRFYRKDQLIRSFVRHLQAAGERPTRARIEAMLAETGRGYRSNPDYLSRALRGGPSGTWKELAPLKYPNGKAVEASGRTYRSIRAAAEGEGVAVETVRKRIRAGEPGWRYVA